MPFALLATRRAWRSATLWPLNAIAPPFVRPAAESRPVAETSPPAPPLRMIEPPTARAEATESEPGTFTALRIACATVAALSSTLPPAATTLPETSINALPSAVLAFVGTATCRKLSPVRLRVACSPEPIPTLPSGTDTTPEFATVPPTRPTKPPGPASIEPALETPADAPFPVKLRLPLLKSRSAMPSVEATKPPPTWTAPVGVIAIPFGLTR